MSDCVAAVILRDQNCLPRPCGVETAPDSIPSPHRVGHIEETDTDTEQQGASTSIASRKAETGTRPTILVTHSTNDAASSTRLRSKKRGAPIRNSHTSSTQQDTKTGYPFSIPAGYLMRPTSGAVRLFVASIGNPSPYHNTRHSAGHVLLKQLQFYLGLPALTKSKNHGGGYVSSGAHVGAPRWTLWQSNSTMNVSGVGLTKAYKQFLSSVDPADVNGIVVLHDEMETAPAQLKIRRGPTSAKGHNGIKSVQQCLQSAGMMGTLMQGARGKDNVGARYVKIGIGIGRPASGSRDTGDVSSYVLGQLTSAERANIEGAVGKLVQDLDEEVERMSVGS